MLHNKHVPSHVPTTHFRAYVSSGRLYLTASSVHGVNLLSEAFPNAVWPHDEDGTRYCDTGISVRDTPIVFAEDQPKPNPHRTQRWNTYPASEDDIPF